MRWKTKGDVQWHLPNKKLPVAYSTKAVSDLIVMIAQMEETIQDVYDNIFYDHDAKGILKIYMKKGYGHCRAHDFFK